MKKHLDTEERLTIEPYGMPGFDRIGILPMRPIVENVEKMETMESMMEKMLNEGKMTDEDVLRLICEKIGLDELQIQKMIRKVKEKK